MTLSSKLTFSLIAITALLLSGSTFVFQADASSFNDVGGGGTDAGFNAPEFTCNHINTTATHCTFDVAVNGTLAIADWGIRDISTNSTNIADGDITYDYAISNIANSSSTGVGLTAPNAQDIRQSSNATPISKTEGLGFLNGTDFVLIHEAIPSDARYYINFTGNPAVSTNSTAGIGGSGIFASSGLIASAELGLGGEGSANNKNLKVGSNATAQDWMAPSVVSAEVLKSNPQQIRLLMSESIAHINSTAAHFNFTTGGGGNDAVSAQIIGSNGSSYLYVNLQNAANIGDVLTLQYTTADTPMGLNVIDGWVTDAIDTTKYTNSGDAQSTEWYLSGHGNKMLNFTVSVTNWLEIGMFGDVTTCYDCTPPTVTDVKISLDSSTPITVNDDNKVQINASIGDTVSVMVTVADNLGADTVPFVGLYTNFGETPDNLFYANNFDNTKQMSTSYYEWNVNSDDIAFDNNGAITWTDATAKVNPDRTQTFTYTMTINDEIESSQVWVDLGDNSGNYAKLALPITLEVSGAPGITFASDDSQKVVSFFNESILLAIVSQWTATSSDDATNVEQLSSVLGIESQLPTWTTDLASWVADDKIDVADMIVAVEYVINQ